MGRKGKQKKSEQLNFNKDDVHATIIEAKLHLIVSNMAGDLLEFDLPADRTVSAVKRRVSKEWELPAAGLDILIGESLADDSETIKSYCSSTSACEDDRDGLRLPGDNMQVLSVMVVLNCDKLYALLSIENDIETRADALKSLGVLAKGKPAQGERFITEICLCFGDANKVLRDTAVEVLQKCVSRGDQLAIGELCKQMAHPSPASRLAAVTCLGKIAERGDDHATTSLVQALTDTTGGADFQVAVLQALARVSAEDNDIAIRAILPKLLPHSRNICEQAGVTLAALSSPGNVEVTRSLTKCLRGYDFVSKPLPPGSAASSIVRALQHIAPAGDRDATDALTDMLQTRPLFYNDLDKYIHPLVHIAQKPNIQVDAILENAVRHMEEFIEDSRKDPERDHRKINTFLAPWLASARRALRCWHDKEEC